MKALEITSLSKSFSGIQALKEVSIEVATGEMLAVLGPSGCGKTTLLRSIAGFETADSGQIMLGGKIVFGDGIDLKPEKRKIGYVAQEGALFPHLTVEQNIAFGLSRKEKGNGRIAEMLELVGMPGYENRMPQELSGGQQQRIALARALAPSPTLVLLDEPFSALDAGLRASLREDVKKALKATGATAVLVTHDQEEAFSMADVIAVMREGKCIQTSDPVSLYKYPADLDVATFVGDATILQAKVCGGYVHCPLGELAAMKCCTRECENASVMIRPEQFIIGDATDNIRGEVVRTTFYGHDSIVHLRLDPEFGGNEIQIRIMGTHKYESGERVGLKIDGEVMTYPIIQEVLSNQQMEVK